MELSAQKNKKILGTTPQKSSALLFSNSNNIFEVENNQTKNPLQSCNFTDFQLNNQNFIHLEFETTRQDDSYIFEKCSSFCKSRKMTIDTDFEPLVSKKFKPSLEKCRFRDKEIDFDQKSRNYSNDSTGCITSETNSVLNSPNLSTFFVLDKSFDEELEDFKLDRKESFSENEILRKELIEILEEREAFLIEEDFKLINEETTISLKCLFKHQFNINLSQIKSGLWCNKCEINLEKIQNYAISMEGKLISKILLKSIDFTCKFNHQWSCNNSSWNKKWCPICMKIKKDMNKKLIEEKENEIQKRNKKIQEDLFKEAKKKMFEEEERKSYNKINNNMKFNEKKPNSHSLKIVEAFKKVEKEIEKVAEIQAKDYSKKNSNIDYNFAQLIAVYSMILIPDEIMKTYLCALNINEIKSVYRKKAILIHPDKNNHPQARASFKKLSNHYNFALQKLN